MKKSFPALLLALALLLATPVQATQEIPRQRTYAGEFSDLSAGSSFYDNVAALYEYGLSNGKTDGSFGLRDSLTVGQAVIFAGRVRTLCLTGDPESGPTSYRAAGDPAVTDPDDPDPDASSEPGETETPDDGSMPEGGNAGGTSSGGTSSGGTSSGGTNSGGTSGTSGMSYASAAALPGGLTLSRTDFSRKVSEGDWQLKVSGGTGTYTWISENPSIAKVSSDGTVTPVASGTTNVVVTDGSKKAICIVRVSGSASSGGTSSGGTSSGGTSSGGTSSGGGSAAPSGSLRTGRATVINGGNGVRVRSGPGTNYEILATIPNGGSVQVVSSAGNDWYEITFTAVGGVTTSGYMKGEFLSNS